MVQLSKASRDARPTDLRTIEKNTSTTVYYDTYPDCVARILHSQSFILSSASSWLGCETRAPGDVTYFAESDELAYRYAWPSACMKDSLYYGFKFDVEIETNSVHSKHGARRGNGTEVLVKPGYRQTIRKVTVFFNTPIKQGLARNWNPRPEHELIPNAWAEDWAYIAPAPLRERL